MLEYRIKPMPPALRKALKAASADIVEEKFKGRKSWLVYTEEPIHYLLDSFAVEYSLQEVASIGWDKLWMNYLEEGWLTDNFYYVYEAKNFDDERQLIQINPALAFGTGGHATTRIAAQLLETVADKQYVLDIGTGSGILSIMASKCGAKSVYAFDNDPVAVRNTAENVALNHCENISVWAGSVTSIKSTAKITTVVANIISSVLLKLHPHILTLHPKYIVYSGILTKEANDFIAELHLHDYSLMETMRMDEWTGFVLKRNKSNDPHIH